MATTIQTGNNNTALPPPTDLDQPDVNNPNALQKDANKTHDKRALEKKEAHAHQLGREQNVKDNRADDVRRKNDIGATGISALAKSDGVGGTTPQTLQQVMEQAAPPPAVDIGEAQGHFA